jgi:t-SNARE complex subunit (syntaxin)
MDFIYYNGTKEQSDKSKTANKTEQIKPSFFRNRKKLIIFCLILFVIVIVAIVAVIMIVLATASKRI